MLIDGRHHDRNPSGNRITKLAVVIDHTPNLAASRNPIVAIVRQVLRHDHAEELARSNLADSRVGCYEVIAKCE